LLDRHGLLAHGDRVEACQGSPHGGGSDDPDGSRVALEGLLQGHDVWRRVAAAACGCRAGPTTRCWRTPLQATPPHREASRGRCEPPRLCTCKRHGHSVGGLRVRGWSRRRARWHGWQGAG
jgi:hypothetical protein